MKYLQSILLLALSLPPLVSFGQVERVFKQNEISESALLDALTPKNGTDKAATQKTRSYRISPVGNGVSSRAKRPSAAILITFETNSADLTPPAKQALDTIGRVLQSDKLTAFKFAIEGHADPRGGEQFNLQLSQKRAEMVVRYLSESQQIDAGRLVAVGKGQTQLMNTSNPLAPENRRVTVTTLVE
jgi:outer membrane protein OmpA-like peptidoglycan-associated protein